MVITEEIHKIRGTTPFDELLDALEPQEGPKKKTKTKTKKNDFEGTHMAMRGHSL